MQSQSSQKEEYKMLELLGSGTYGKVYEALHLPTMTRVAIKQIDLPAKYSSELLVSLSREIYILSKLKNNPYVVRLQDAFFDKEEVSENEDNAVNLVFELHNFTLKDIKNSKLNENQVIVIAFNLIKSIESLHKQNIMHRDLKPSNILILPTCSIKLCDFGFARSIAC
jgi:serine/threonine protein kinase